MTASTSEPTAIAWIESEVARHHGKGAELPSSSSDTSLCEFLRDGRALCLLVAALSAELAANNNNEEALAIPKKISKSMHQLSTFHALERIHFFIRWCRAAAKLEEHLVFTSVQLLDEQNADAVLACIDTLRARFRPTFPVKTDAPIQQEEVVDDTNNQDDDDDEEQDADAPGSSTTAAVSASANKLSAFLTKVPSAPPSAPVLLAPPATERSTSLSARLSGASLTGSTTSSRHASSASLASDRADELESSNHNSESDGRARSLSSSSSSRLSASPRGGSVSKLKLPGAFASLATVSIPTPPPQQEEEEEPVAPAVVEEQEPEVASTTPNRDAVDTSDEMIKHVSKLEIPPVFGRSSSIEDAAKADGVKRSVSKLRIPAAFSGAGAGADAGAPPPVEEEPVAPVPEEPVSNSPKSKLAAFAKTLAPEPTPTAAVAAEPAAPSKKKSTGKLKIPAAFGKAVGAAAPVPKKKPVTKLSAFLSTVENDVPPPIEAKPERRFAFPIPGTAEAKKPAQVPTAKKAKAAAAAPAKKVAAFTAFMQKVPVAAPKPAARVERDAVPETPVERHEEPVAAVAVAVEEKQDEAPAAVDAPVEPTPAGNKPSALLAFMKKVVVTPPAPAPRVERDGAPTEPTEEVNPVEEAVVVEQEVAEPVVMATEETEEAAPSPPKANKLLAFLAAVESPTGSASEEEDDEDVSASAPTVHVSVEVDQKAEEEEEDNDDDEEEEDATDAVESAVSVPDVAGEAVVVAVAVVNDGESVEKVPAAPAVADETKPVAVPSEAAISSATPSAETELETHTEEDDDHDHEFANQVVESFPDHDVIVEVSGELTHEAALARRRLSSSCDTVPPPRRARSRSPVRSPKSHAARKLFEDDGEENQATHTETMETAVIADDVVVKTDEESEPSVVSAEFEALKRAKQQLDAENEALRAELTALRTQLETQKQEAAAAQSSALALVRQEFDAAQARLAGDHDVALQSARSLAHEEATAALEAKLTTLKQELADQQLELAQSKESEEAARYAAQMAFAARDKAEEESRALRAA